MSDEDPKVLKTNAKAAAESLGISTALIRRYALDYEKVYPPLPRDTSNARVYDEVFCQTVMSALEIRKSGLSTGLVEAFELIRDDAVPEVVPLPSLVRTDGSAFSELGAGIEALGAGQQEIIALIVAQNERIKRLEAQRQPSAPVISDSKWDSLFRRLLYLSIAGTVAYLVWLYI
jgi:hypothetical protein